MAPHIRPETLDLAREKRTLNRQCTICVPQLQLSKKNPPVLNISDSLLYLADQLSEAVAPTDRRIGRTGKLPT
ncbi:hypothetical protein V5799_020849 [Amblyomma americanum]|uniref:Uncharacterized protein n=1 Tax=Amblyomma americanum TaxID=6943 RepID=A0AAQ4ET79_AMBAM